MARHAETDSNVMKLWVSDADYPINEKGKNQARKLAEILRPYNFEYIITSDKRRAIQTAEILSETLNIPILKHDPDFRDRYYGEVEGLTSKEIMERFGIEMKNSLNEEIDFLKGTETVHQLEERVRKSINSLVKDYGNRRIILITHGAFARMFYRIYHGNDYKIYFYNCSNAIFDCGETGCTTVRDIVNIDEDDGS